MSFFGPCENPVLHLGAVLEEKEWLVHPNWWPMKQLLNLELKTLVKPGGNPRFFLCFSRRNHCSLYKKTYSNMLQDTFGYNSLTYVTLHANDITHLKILRHWIGVKTNVGLLRSWGSWRPGMRAANKWCPSVAPYPHGITDSFFPYRPPLVLTYHICDMI